MKRKFILFSIFASVATAAIAAVSFRIDNVSNVIADQLSKVDNETITFDYSHTDPSTKYGNKISTYASGYFSKGSNSSLAYFGNASSNGEFGNSTPFQSISKIEISWSGYWGYSFTFNVGTSKGGSNIQSTQLLGMCKSGSATSTYTISNPSDAHYFSFSASKFDTSTWYKVSYVKVTYSCI